MATGSREVILVPGLVSGADLSAKQYHVARLNSTGQVDVGTGGTGINIGILQNDPVSGEPALVVAGGVSKAVAEASVAINSLLTSNSTGQVQATTTANDQIVGRALSASSSAGDIINVLVYLGNL